MCRAELFLPKWWLSVHLMRELPPIRWIEGHKPRALEKMDGSASTSEEDVTTALEAGSFEVDWMTAVFENAIDESTVHEALVVDLDGLASDCLALNNLHLYPSLGSETVVKVSGGIQRAAIRISRARCRMTTICPSANRI